MVARPADNVTSAPAEAREALLGTRPSLLPFDPKDMLAIRVRPASFATMCGVSRQSVSQWVKKGWITLGPDGLVDPVAATRQLLSRTDPSRIRARIFREALEPLGALRARIQSLEAEVARAKDAAADSTPNAELAVRLDHFIDAIFERLDLEDRHRQVFVDQAMRCVLSGDQVTADSRGTPQQQPEG